MSARTHALRGALEAVDRILNRGGDADDVLREVVAALHDRLGYAFVGLSFVEGDRLVLGPHRGDPDPATAAFPVRFQDRNVAELAVAAPGLDDEERACLERVAVLVSAHCLVGWDTGGVPWPGYGV